MNDRSVHIRPPSRVSRDLNWIVATPSERCVLSTSLRHADRLFTLLKEAEGRVRVRRTPFHVQLWLLRGGEAPIDLKIDLVNDVAPRVGVGLPDH